MAAENFNVTCAVDGIPTGKYGIIQYSFEWMGFANSKNDKIEIGDVFEGGLYLSKDDTLIIKCPEGYTPKDITPSPDDIKDSDIIWYGQRDFKTGEPRIVFERSGIIPWYAILTIIVMAIVGTFFLRKIKERFKKAENLTESDEDIIIKILKDAGGTLYQSEILKKTKFSKSKLSNLLKSMGNQGMIKKIKKGRKNLIVLKNTK